MGFRMYLPDLPRVLLNALPSNLSALLEAFRSKVSAGVACSVSACKQRGETKLRCSTLSPWPVRRASRTDQLLLQTALRDCRLSACYHVHTCRCSLTSSKTSSSAGPDLLSELKCRAAAACTSASETHLACRYSLLQTVSMHFCTQNSLLLRHLRACSRGRYYITQLRNSCSYDSMRELRKQHTLGH